MQYRGRMVSRLFPLHSKGLKVHMLQRGSDRLKGVVGDT